LLARFPSARFAINFSAPFIFIIPLVFLTHSNNKAFLSADERIDIPTLSSVPSTPVIFIVFDELPSTLLMDQNREIHQAFFPNFAKLAGSSIWYRNTVTVSTATPESVPAILTGCYPKQGASPDWKFYPKNLLVLFRNKYLMNV
jgi:hypothetical protein